MIPREAIEAFADARCGGRWHNPVDCPARPIYLREGKEALEAALPYLPGLSALTTDQLAALIHVVGYVLFTTSPDEYRYHRDALAPAQQILDAELSRRRGGEDG